MKYTKERVTHAKQVLSPLRVKHLKADRLAEEFWEKTGQNSKINKFPLYGDTYFSVWQINKIRKVENK